MWLFSGLPDPAVGRSLMQIGKILQTMANLNAVSATLSFIADRARQLTSHYAERRAPRTHAPGKGLPRG
jgi:hypothetical protein